MQQLCNSHPTKLQLRRLTLLCVLLLALPPPFVYSLQLSRGLCACTGGFRPVGSIWAFFPMLFSDAISKFPLTASIEVQVSPLRTSRTKEEPTHKLWSLHTGSLHTSTWRGNGEIIKRSLVLWGFRGQECNKHIYAMQGQNRKLPPFGPG